MRRIAYSQQNDPTRRAMHCTLQGYLNDQVQAASLTADETIGKARQTYHEYYNKV